MKGGLLGAGAGRGGERRGEEGREEGFLGRMSMGNGHIRKEAYTFPCVAPHVIQTSDDS